MAQRRVLSGAHVLLDIHWNHGSANSLYPGTWRATAIAPGTNRRRWSRSIADQYSFGRAVELAGLLRISCAKMADLCAFRRVDLLRASGPAPPGPNEYADHGTHQRTTGTRCCLGDDLDDPYPASIMHPGSFDRILCCFY